MSLHIASINTKGLADYRKRGEIKRFVHSSTEILFLQETHGTPEVITLQQWCKQLGFDDAVFSTYKSNARGSAVLVRGGWTIVKSRTDKEGRIAAANIIRKGKKFTVVSVYAPNVSHAIQTQELHIAKLNELHTLVEELNPDCNNIIIGGDLNIVMEPLDSFEEKPSIYYDCVDNVVQIRESLNLDDAYRMLYPDDQTSTFSPCGKNAKGIYRRLDYVLLSESLSSYLVECNHNYAFFSDHKEVQVRLDLEQVKPEGRGALWRHDDDLNGDQTYLEEAKLVIKTAEEETLSDHRQKWEFIKYKLRQHSRKFTRQKKENERLLLDKAKKELEEMDRDVKRNMEKYEEVKELYIKLARAADNEIMKKSKVMWIEENEKCTKFFYRRIKERAKESNIVSLWEGDRLLEEKEINCKIQEYYKKLYEFKEQEEYNVCQCLKGAASKSGIDIHKDITKCELTQVLFLKLNPGKSPGNDGLTVGFYKALWDHLKDHLFNSLSEGIREGKLSASQRQSVVRLIKKKGKESKEVKDYRPISLMNVDVKIFSRLLAVRLEKALCHIIGPEQLAFTKGRNISEGIRLIDYIVEDALEKTEPLIVCAYDFTKAFDSISHRYLWTLLSQVGINGILLQMIKTLYSGMESCVFNAGKSTNFFPLEKSVRQGDALSPYLFILAIEPLIRNINMNNKIQGYKLPSGKTIKLTVYADDVTGFAANNSDVEEMAEIFQDFAKKSGLELNRTKSELMPIGETSTQNLQRLGFEIVQQVKITGVIFGMNGSDKTIQEANFKPALEKMRKAFTLWKTRDLSLLGRVMIAKSQGISQLLYFANAIEVPEWVIKEARKIVYNFIWKGPDKITRMIQARPVDKGGINMPFLDEAIAAAGIQWFRKRIGHRERPWASFLDRDFGKYGGYEYLNCKRTGWDKKKLQISSYNKYLIKCWDQINSALGTKQPLEESSVWWNRRISATKGRNRLAVGTKLWKLGYIRFRDFCDYDGRIIEAEDAIVRGLHPELKAEWKEATRVMPKFQSTRGGEIGETIGERVEGHEPDGVSLWAGEEEFPLQELKYSRIIELLRKRACEIQEDVPYRKRMMAEYGETEKEWENAYNNIWKVSNETKMRSFIIRYLSGTTYANKDYKRFGVKKTGKCSFCDEARQSKEHLFIRCPRVQDFWQKIEQEIVRREIKDKEKVRGSGDVTMDYIIFHSLQYIHRKNYYQEELSLTELLTWFRTNRNVEKSIAQKKGSLSKHNAKWYKLGQYI